MEFNRYIRKPFTVGAVEITEDNFEEVAEEIGDIRENEKGERYILPDPKKIPNVKAVYIGWFYTKMGKTYKCFNPKTFKEQFTDHEPHTGYFFDEEGEPVGIESPAEVPATVNVFDQSADETPGVDIDVTNNVPGEPPQDVYARAGIPFPSQNVDGQRDLQSVLDSGDFKITSVTVLSEPDEHATGYILETRTIEDESA